MLLQAIPGLSPVPWWGTMFPLAVVLLVNAVKEGFDDYWRHKSDEDVNHRKVTLLREDGDLSIYWKNLQASCSSSSDMAVAHPSAQSFLHDWTTVHFHTLPSMAAMYVVHTPA